MRTILFRGKREDNGEWVEGSLTIDANNNYQILHPLSDKSGDTFWNNKFQFFEVDPTTVCQYTGQADKNETMVFDHDRVKHPIRGIGVIKWDDLLSCYYIAFEDRVSRFSLEKISEYEIIGNIHDKK